MKLRWIFMPLIVLLGSLPFWLRYCAGPRAEVDAVAMEKVEGGYRVRATVKNRSGDGQVNLLVRLHDKKTGAIWQAVDSPDLRRGEQLDVGVEVRAPEGDYWPEVEVRYPPD
jgi:hypothetical protein